MKYSIDPRFTLAAAFAAALFSTPTLPQSKGDSLTGEYEVVPNWPRPWSQQGYIWGSHAAVFAESEDRVYLAVRGELRLPATLPSGFPGFWGFSASSAWSRTRSRATASSSWIAAAIASNRGHVGSFWAANAKPGALGPIPSKSARTARRHV
jgi:hypothetical protein